MSGLSEFCTINEIVIQATGRYPDRLALVSEDGSLSYRQFAHRISQVTQLLKSLGLKASDGLAMVAANSIEVAVVNSAAHMLGMRYTPLHPSGSEDDHAFCLKDADIRALVVDNGPFADRGRALEERVPGVEHLLVIGPSAFGVDVVEASFRYSPEPLVDEANSTDIARISYTGGTTGKPKGVIHTHRPLLACITLAAGFWDWPQTTRFLAAAPISHAAGAMLYPVMIRGGTFFMQKGFSPASFLGFVESHSISCTFMVPTMIYALLDSPELGRRDISSLESIMYGAAPMSQARMLDAIERIGPVFSQLYGQTEAPNCISYLCRDDHDPARPERLLSCGTPLPGIVVRVLNEAGREVPRGEPGEICVRGPLVMDGYWRRPRETAEAFRDKWLHTGDIAWQDENGYLYIVDRLKDMIVSGGFNVFPREVEEALLAHPAVSAAAVIGVPDDRWGESVAAFVVLLPDASVEEQALIAHVRTLKGSIQTPKRITVLPSLPVTALGKVEKKVLRQQYWPDGGRQVS